MDGSICYDYDMCSLSHHLQRLCVGSCREKHKHTHARVPHAYGGRHPTVHPKAPWEICKLTDAHHWPLYPGPRTDLTPTCRVSIRTRVWPVGFCWRGVYEYLQFKTAHCHKHILAPERSWRWVKNKTADLSASTKVISPTKELKHVKLNLTLNFPFSHYTLWCSWYVY